MAHLRGLFTSGPSTYKSIVSGRRGSHPITPARLRSHSSRPQPAATERLGRRFPTCCGVRWLLRHRPEATIPARGI